MILVMMQHLLKQWKSLVNSIVDVNLNHITCLLQKKIVQDGTS